MGKGMAGRLPECYSAVTIALQSPGSAGYFAIVKGRCQYAERIQ